MLGAMLGRLLVGAAVAALGTAVAVLIVRRVRGKITREKLAEAIAGEGVKKAVIQKGDKCRNKVHLKDLCSDKKIDVEGDGIDEGLSDGDIID